MKKIQSNYAKYLFVPVFIIVIFFIYKIFFSNSVVDDHRHLQHQAHVALHNEKYEQVIEICNKGIEEDTSASHAYHMYIKKAKALNKLERYKEAIDSADRAIAIDPKNEEGYSVKVEPLFHLGQEEKLTAVLEEIIAINPHSPLKALLNSLRLQRGKAEY